MLAVLPEARLAESRAGLLWEGGSSMLGCMGGRREGGAATALRREKAEEEGGSWRSSSSSSLSSTKKGEEGAAREAAEVEAPRFAWRLHGAPARRPAVPVCAIGALYVMHIITLHADALLHALRALPLMQVGRGPAAAIIPRLPTGQVALERMGQADCVESCEAGA